MSNYKTPNFYLSVWLLAKGYVPHIEYVKPNSNKAVFVFDGLTEEEAEDSIQEFHQDEVMQEFIQAIKKLKDMLYTDREPEIYR
jgi:hypothetical protein